MINYAKNIFILVLAFLCFIPSLRSTENIKQEPEEHRLVILGGGIGGLTSALYAARAGMTPLVIEGPLPGGAIVQSHSVQNWPGEIEIAGSDLMERIHKQAEHSGTIFLQEAVVAVDFSSLPFKITTQNPLEPHKKKVIRAETCIIALGSSAKFLGIPGEQGENGYWLKGVYNCALCDGPLFKNKTVAVVGGGDGALVEAHYLSRLAKKVYLIVRGENFRAIEEPRKKEVLASPNIEVLFSTTVEEIKGDGEELTHLIIKDKKQNKQRDLKVDGLFLAIGSKPNTDMLSGQLELDRLGYIVLKGDTQTSIPGVFAIGDIADPIYRQAISAAADGMKAIYQVEKYLASQSHTEPTKALKVSEKTAITHPLSSAAVKGVIEINSAKQFEQELKEGNLPVIVDFYASWCPPCKVVAPYFASAAKKLENRVKFCKVNVDQVSSTSEQYRIRAMPSILIFDRGGRLLGKKVGSKDIIKFLRELDALEGEQAAKFEDFFAKVR